MKHAWLGWAVTMLALGSLAIAQTVEERENLVTKELKGFKFKVPADWPVEDRNGQVGPVPVEEYLSKKFIAVSARLADIETRLTAVETRLADAEQKSTSGTAADQRLSTLEQRLTNVEHSVNDKGRAARELKDQIDALGPRAAPAAGDLVPKQVEEP